jgi:hypothetical protein
VDAVWEGGNPSDGGDADQFGYGYGAAAKSGFLQLRPALARTLILGRIMPPVFQRVGPVGLTDITIRALLDMSFDVSNDLGHVRPVVITEFILGRVLDFDDPTSGLMPGRLSTTWYAARSRA